MSALTAELPLVVAQVPSDEQVEAAAEAWLVWQFPGRSWASATEAMKNKFRDGARVIVSAALNVRRCS